MKLKLPYDEQSKIFVTADLHLLHKNILTIQNGTRSHYANIDDMTLKITKMWNFTVRPCDKVFILGDFCFGTKAKWKDILDKLNGTKYLVKGNHDSDKQIPKEMFELVTDYIELETEIPFLTDTKQLKGDNSQEVLDLISSKLPFCAPLLFVMSHYPMLRWNKAEYGSIMLHGHNHGNIPTEHRNCRRIDVGWDVYGKPVQLTSLFKPELV